MPTVMGIPEDQTSITFFLGARVAYSAIAAARGVACPVCLAAPEVDCDPENDSPYALSMIGYNGLGFNAIDHTGTKRHLHAARIFAGALSLIR